MNKVTSFNYQKYNNRNPFAQYGIRRFLKTLHGLLKDTGVNNILDMGCGEGFYIYYLTQNYPFGLDITGIDYNYDALCLAKKMNPNVKFIQGNIYNIPYKDKSFDMVLCLEVLEHLEAVGSALAELCRVARRYCLLSIPHEPYFSVCRLLGGKDILRLGRHPQHLHQFKVKKTVKMLKDYFELKKTVTSFPWIFILGEIK